MPPQTAPTCWVVSEARAELQNQCIGLAEALGLDYHVQPIRPPVPWKFLPAHWSPKPLAMVAGPPLQEPWPHVVISCGRNSVPTAQAIAQGSGIALAIHIEDPYRRASAFDAVIACEQDALRGDNVLTKRGDLHRVTPERMTDAAAQFAATLSHLPRPIIGVLVGSSDRRQDVTETTAHELAQFLAEAGRQTAGSLAIVPSLGIGKRVSTILAEAVRTLPAYAWDGKGQHPYHAIMGLADALVVAGDSTAMISEACSSGKPVYIYSLPGERPRLRHLREGLIRDGLARPFTGRIKPWPVTPLNETQAIARALHQRFPDRLPKPR